MPVAGNKIVASSIDSSVTAGSSNLITSGAVANALANLGTKFYNGTFTNLKDCSTEITWTRTWLTNNSSSLPRAVNISFPEEVSYVYVFIPNYETLYSTSSTYCYGDTMTSIEFFITPTYCVGQSHGDLAWRMRTNADNMETVVGVQPTLDEQVFITDISHVTTDVPGPTTLYKIGAFENNVDCYPGVYPANHILGSWSPESAIAIGWN